MLGSRPHQRLGSVPPLTSVAPGREVRERVDRGDELQVRAEADVGLPPLPGSELRPSGSCTGRSHPPSAARCRTRRPRCRSKPGQTPGRRAAAPRPGATTDVPAGGVPASSVKGCPPCRARGVYRPRRCTSSAATSVAPQGRTSIESDVGGVTIAGSAARHGERHVLTSSFVVLNTSRAVARRAVDERGAAAIRSACPSTQRARGPS